MSLTLSAPESSSFLRFEYGGSLQHLLELFATGLHHLLITLIVVRAGNAAIEITRSEGLRREFSVLRI